MGKRKVTKNTPNTGGIVLSAIRKLMRNTGWTTRTIVKFIKLEYRIFDPNLGRRVGKALKRGVKSGLLEMENGRYRLRSLSRLVKPVSVRELRTKQRERTLQFHTRSRSRRNSRSRSRSRSPSIRAYDYFA